MAIGLPGNGLLDFTANNYGNQFQNLQTVTDIWRKGDLNYDLEVGYSHGLSDGSIDIRCKYNAYQFTIGNNQTINGSKGGVELLTGDGLCRLAWEIGYDKDKATYNSIAASINMGFQLDALMYGQLPISMPQSIFMSPERNPRRLLAQKVRRNTNLPDKVVAVNNNGPGPGPVPPPPPPGGAHFELAINGPYWTSEAPGSTGTYTKTSDTSGTWTITYGLNGGAPASGYLCAAHSYTITLVGDTTGLPSSLMVTIIPNATPSTIEMRVAAANGPANVQETVTMTIPGDVVKTIGKPLGDACCSGGGCTVRCIPEMFVPPGTSTTTTGGNFTISAPGVPSLVVNLVSTN